MNVEKGAPKIMFRGTIVRLSDGRIGEVLSRKIRNKYRVRIGSESPEERETVVVKTYEMEIVDGPDIVGSINKIRGIWLLKSEPSGEIITSGVTADQMKNLARAWWGSVIFHEYVVQRVDVHTIFIEKVGPWRRRRQT